MRTRHFLAAGGVAAVLLFGAGPVSAETLLSLTDEQPFDFTTFTASVTATGTSEDLTFSIRQDPSYFDLTGISVSTGSSGNLVTNGDFADGFSGYTVSGDTTYSGFGTGGPTGTYLYLGTIGSATVLTQTISTTPGQVYDIRFDLANEGGAPNIFTASFGDPLMSAVPLPPALSLFGAALAALAAVGYGARGRTVRSELAG